MSGLLGEGLGKPREVSGTSRKVIGKSLGQMLLKKHTNKAKNSMAHCLGAKVTFLACTLEKLLLNGVM